MVYEIREILFFVFIIFYCRIVLILDFVYNNIFSFIIEEYIYKENNYMIYIMLYMLINRYVVFF